MLCGVCKAVFTNLNRHPLGSDAAQNRSLSPPPKVFGVHQQSWTNLRSSAASKCQICTVIVEKALEGDDWQLRRYTTEGHIQKTFYCVDFPGPRSAWGREEAKDYPASIGFHLHEPWNGYGRTNLRAFARFDIVPCSEFDPVQLTQSLMDAQTNNSAKFNEVVAKRWLHQCFSSHKLCNEAPDQPWIPTRLVDVGDPNNSVPPRLVVFPHTQKNIEYLTLSHCWGDAQILKLESHNFAALCNSIPISELPKTFQDAMHAVRKLGYRYIWIDSLCIIQNSEEDWDREALLMNKVYKYSRLDIAATGAEDSHGGCFFDKDQDMIALPQVELAFDLGVFSSSPRRRGRFWGLKRAKVQYHLESKIVRRKYYLIRTDPSWIEELEKARLLNRAWVFQERLLSPRVLHFHRSQLFWECRELRAFESCPKGMPPDQLLYSPAQAGVDMRQILPSANIVSPSSNTPSDFDGTWYTSESWAHFVEAYSAAGLSYSRDKLIALSGIAAEIQRERMDPYLAGLWRGSLLRQLLWFIDEPKPGLTRATRSTEYRAPSWSWASIDGAISMRDTIASADITSPTLAEIVDAQVTATGDKGIGKVTGGYVKIKGHLGHCRWKAARSGSRSATLSDFVPIPPIGDMYADNIQTLTCGIDFDDAGDTIDKYNSIYCLPLVGFVDMNRGENGDYTIGLILIEAARSQFRRIARFMDTGGEDAMLKCRAWPEQVIQIV
jgi:hypothetical protein